MKPTNILFSNGTSNPVRLILGMPGDECRKEYDYMFDKGRRENYEPIVVVRDCEPTVWIEDDSAFVLDLMASGCGEDDWPEGLNEWFDEIMSKDRNVGETFAFEHDGFKLTAKIDGTSMTGLMLLEPDQL